MKWDFGVYKINAYNLEKKHVSPQSTASENHILANKNVNPGKMNTISISILNFNVSINLSICKKVCQI